MSKIEVDTIDKQSGSTLTLGGSGTAVTLASGATQTGFGRTGTVDWQTAIEGYFVNTTGGAITANLPAGSAGAIAAFRDYANTFDSNALTVNSNGSEKINGLTKDLIVSTEGESITLVYADATKGWLVETLPLTPSLLVEILKLTFLQDQALYVYQMQVMQQVQLQ